MSYSINFFDDNQSNIKSTATVLECTSFHKILYQTPSDRHAYSLKFFSINANAGLFTQITEIFKSSLNLSVSRDLKASAVKR